MIVYVYLNIDDITFTFVDTAYFTNSTELPTAFLCACLPTFRPLFRKFVPVSLAKGSRSKKTGRSWGGSSHNGSKKGPWISLGRKSGRQTGLDTIDQAESGSFVPTGSSGLGNSMTAWHHDESHASDSDNIPLQPQAVYVQSKIKVDHSEA